MHVTALYPLYAFQDLDLRFHLSVSSSVVVVFRLHETTRCSSCKTFLQFDCTWAVFIVLAVDDGDDRTVDDSRNVIYDGSSGITDGLIAMFSPPSSPQPLASWTRTCWRCHCGFRRDQVATAFRRFLFRHRPTLAARDRYSACASTCAGTSHENFRGCVCKDNHGPGRSRRKDAWLYCGSERA